MQRILLTQMRRIGDVLMTTPAVRAVRAAWPEAHIVYLTETPSDQIFRHSPHVNEVWAVPAPATWRQAWHWVRRLRRARFDLVIDFYSLPQSAVLVGLSGARRRIGFAFRGRRWAYTDAVPFPSGRRYAPLHKGALLAPLGLELGSPLPEMHLDHAARDDAARLLEGLGAGPDDFLVALLPVSRQPYKLWPVERWAALADWLIETHNAKVLFLWGPGEEETVAAVRAAMRQQALPDYPVPDLPGMAALLERADLYVGNDAGPRHFAIAVGTPTVGVFGRPRPENWTPPQDPRHRAIAHDPGCKAACTYPRCDHLDCIRGIPYASVRDETDALIAAIRHGQLPRRGTPEPAAGSVG